MLAGFGGALVGIRNSIKRELHCWKILKWEYLISSFKLCTIFCQPLPWVPELLLCSQRITDNIVWVGRISGLSAFSDLTESMKTLWPDQSRIWIFFFDKHERASFNNVFHWLEDIWVIICYSIRRTEHNIPGLCLNLLAYVIGIIQMMWNSRHNGKIAPTDPELMLPQSSPLHVQKKFWNP